MIDGLRMDRKERPFFDPAFPRDLALRHATRWTTVGTPSAYPDAAPVGQIEADNGQLGWYGADIGKGLVRVDTPRTQVLVGYVHDADKKTSNLAADVNNEFSAIYLTSLDGQPIAEAERLLLTTTARATLTDFEWEPDRKSVKSWGRAQR